MALYEDRSILFKSESEARERALRSIDERAKSSRHLDSRQRENVDRLIRSGDADAPFGVVTPAKLIIATEDQHYRSWALRALAPRPYASRIETMSPAEESAVARVNALRRSLSLGVAGVLLPSFIDVTITGWSAGVHAPAYDLARKIQTTQEYAKVNYGDVQFGYAAESSESGDDAPTIHQGTVRTYRADAFIPATIEANMDIPGLATQLATMAADGYRQMLGNKILLGSGTNEPEGLITAMAASSDPAPIPLGDPFTIAAADISGAYEAIPEGARESGNFAFLSSTSVRNAVGRLATTDANYDLRLNGAVGNLFGRSYHATDVLPVMPTAAGTQNLIVMGNFDKLVFAERFGIVAEFIPVIFDTGSNRPSGKVGYVFTARSGSKCTDVSSFRLIKNAAS